MSPTDNNSVSTYTFIGAGNMGRALIGGLLANGHRAAAIRVIDTHAASRELCAQQFELAAEAELPADGLNSEVVVLAVKPQQMRAVAMALGRHDTRRGVYVSVAAGITIGHLSAWLGRGTAIVRCMPNTPALIGRGAAALFANQDVNRDQRKLADALLSAVGHAHWLDDERLMDAVTALSGSGPAYFFLFIELLEKIGAEQGLPAELARQLALETAAGASELALHSAHPAEQLRKQVTSPAGTTERALAAFAAGDLENLVRRALEAARNRSIELAKEVSI